jgi:hypothetical protein
MVPEIFLAGAGTAKAPWRKKRECHEKENHNVKKISDVFMCG